MSDGNLEIPPIRGAEKGGPSIHWPEDDLKDPTNEADFNVCVPSAEEEGQEMARGL